jgi:hypothetical protein
VFKDQCGVHQRYWRYDGKVRLDQVAPVQLETGESSKPLLNSVEVLLVDIYSDNSLCDGGVDMFQTVAARYSQYGYALWKTVVKRIFEQVR